MALSAGIATSAVANSGLTFGQQMGLAGLTGGMNLLGGLMSNGLSTYKATKLMEAQANINYNMSKKTAENQYGWMRKGLESANYNPLLAVGSSQGLLNSSFANSQATSNADFSGIGDSMANAYNSTKLSDVQARQLQLNEAGMISSIQKANAETANIESHTELNYQEQQLNVLRGLISELEIQQRGKDLDWYETRQLAELKKAEAAMITALANRTSSNAQMYNAETNALNSEQERKWYGFNHIVGPLIGGAGVAVGAYATKGKGKDIKPYGTKTVKYNYDSRGKQRGYSVTDKYDMY